MELSRPMKNALGLGKFTFDSKSNIWNRIPFSSTYQNNNLDTNQKRRNSKDSTKDEKFSSTLKITHAVPNCIQNLKNLNRKSAVRPQFGVPQYKEDSLSHMPVYHKVLDHFKKVAITDLDGDFLYEDVFRRSCRLANEIVSTLKGKKVDQKVFVVCPNGFSFVVAQWATWMSGNILVPLSNSHSESALEYFLKDCKASLIIGTSATAEKLNPLAKKVDVPILILDKTWTSNPVTEFEDSLNCDTFDQFFYAERHTALLLYSANATGPPRGTLYRHYNLNVQADGIAQVWDLDKKSCVLNALPMNQTYGIVSALLAPMSVGGKVVMMEKFDSVRAWAYLLGVAYNGQKETFPRTKVDVLPSTPEQYYKLYQRYQELFKDPKMKEFVYNRCRKAVRLMLCSSAPLPSGLTDEWRKISGHSILQSFSKPEDSGCHASYMLLQQNKDHNIFNRFNRFKYRVEYRSK